MPERVKIVCEGLHDDAFVAALIRLQRLPEAADFDRGDRRRTRGKDQVLKDMRAHLTSGISVVALLDYDARSGAEFGTWVAGKVDTAAPVETLEGVRDTFVLRHETGAVAIVLGVGHIDGIPAELARTEGGNVDEYVLRMLLDESTYAHASELNELPYATWRAKIVETRELIVRNGLLAPTAKQLCRLPHVLTAFQGAPPTLMDKLMNAANEVSRLDELTDPLRSSLVRAVEHLARGGG